MFGSLTLSMPMIYQLPETAQILNGKAPFFDLGSDAAVVKKVLQGNRPPRPIHNVFCPHGIWLMIRSCWAHHPQDRPDACLVTASLGEWSTMYPQEDMAKGEPEKVRIAKHANPDLLQTSTPPRSPINRNIGYSTTLDSKRPQTIHMYLQ
jgi:hypothetical protein